MGGSNPPLCAKVRSFAGDQERTLAMKKNREVPEFEADCPECFGDSIVPLYEDEQKMFSSEFSMSRCRTCSGQGSVFLVDRN